MLTKSLVPSKFPPYRYLEAVVDAPPLAGRWPTSLWLPGVPLNDPHTVPLPPDLPAGIYELWVGLYDPGGGQRLPLPDGSDVLRLTEVRLP